MRPSILNFCDLQGSVIILLHFLSRLRGNKSILTSSAFKNCHRNLSFTLFNILLTAQTELKKQYSLYTASRFQLWRKVNYKEENWVIGNKDGKENLMFIFKKFSNRFKYFFINILINLKLEKEKMSVLLLWRHFEEMGKNYL